MLELCEFALRYFLLLQWKLSMEWRPCRFVQFESRMSYFMIRFANKRNAAGVVDIFLLHLAGNQSSVINTKKKKKKDI